MKTIREICDNKPSVAVKHMLNGLKKAVNGEWSNFEIDMGTFGQPEGDMCYGCAATCAMLQHVIHRILGLSNRRQLFSYHDLLTGRRND